MANVFTPVSSSSRLAAKCIRIHISSKPQSTASSQHIFQGACMRYTRRSFHSTRRCHIDTSKDTPPSPLRIVTNPEATIARLRSSLQPQRPAVAMAAHNALSAKLAVEAGFDAIWVSGFELAAAHAVPDASILPMSTSLAATRAMASVLPTPLIVDLDTGFGNAVNVAYVIPQFAAAGAAAVVLEDKTFPKDSSLRPGGRQALVPTGEFEGKIAAAKAASDMLVFARTEALIAGLGLEAALSRATAYAQAGADAVLVHSKQPTPDEILDFCAAWDGRVPLVLVPTSYPQLSFAAIAELRKVGLVICGNHAVRSAVAALRRTFKRIRDEGGIAGVEAEIASVADVFALQGDAQMRELEKAFLR